MNFKFGLGTCTWNVDIDWSTILGLTLYLFLDLQQCLDLRPGYIYFLDLVVSPGFGAQGGTSGLRVEP